MRGIGNRDWGSGIGEKEPWKIVDKNNKQLRLLIIF